jgi:hypothetical protein
MGVNLLYQLSYIRNVTLSVAKDVTAEEADVIPEGFRNHIRWNLGHILTTQDRLTFAVAGLPSHVPAGYGKWFGRESTPLTWEGDAPALDELLSRLEAQPEQIRQALEGKLDTKLEKPFTLGTGLTLETIGDSLNYSLYHEGVHLSVIKAYIRLIRRK